MTFHLSLSAASAFAGQWFFTLVPRFHVFGSCSNQMVFRDAEPFSGPAPPAGAGEQRGGVSHSGQRERQCWTRPVR